MMAIKISHEGLKIISSCLTSIKDDEFTKSLDDFIKEKKDDYYFSGRESIDVNSLKIEIFQLERILAYRDMQENNNLYEILNSIYQSAIGTGQKSVYLYRRMR